MRKRGIVFAAALFSISMLFSSCQKKEAEAVAEDGKTTIKWAVWDYELISYWSALKEEFEAAHPDIRVEQIDLGSTDYSNVLATELSGTGTSFDVVSIKDMPSYAVLIDKNVIEPLNSYIDKDSVDLEQYAGITDQISADGKLYELPFRSDFWVIYFNKDLFDAKGLPYPGNGMTFEEYDKLARAVSDDSFGSEVYGAHYHTWSSAVQLFGILDGKHSVLDGKYDFMKPFYEMVLAQEDDRICMKYSDLKTESLHYAAAFANGNIAMMNMGTWNISRMMDNLKSGEYDSELIGNWGMARYPYIEDGGQPGNTLGTITGLSMVSESSKKDAAWEFIKWVGGEAGATVMAETANFPAIANDNITKIISSKEGFPQDETTLGAMKFTNMYLEVPYGKNLSAINNIIGTYHDMIMTRELSIDEGIGEMNAEAAKAMK